VDMHDPQTGTMFNDGLYTTLVLFSNIIFTMVLNYYNISLTTKVQSIT